jgi:plastocyanin
MAFDTKSINVTKGARVTIEFDNQDPGVPHNVSVYRTPEAKETIFRGEIITGPAKTKYTFKAPNEAGTYFFRCDVHPTTMTGDFIVS